MTASEHGYRALLQRCAVRRYVDAARQSRHHDEARIGEIARKLCGVTHSGGGSIARANNSDGGLVQLECFTANREQGRRIVDFA